MQAVAYRLPKWHPDTRRWRLRIGFYFDAQGRRVERTFWWPGQLALQRYSRLGDER